MPKKNQYTVDFVVQRGQGQRKVEITRFDLAGVPKDAVQALLLLLDQQMPQVDSRRKILGLVAQLGLWARLYHPNKKAYARVMNRLRRHIHTRNYLNVEFPEARRN